MCWQVNTLSLAHKQHNSGILVHGNVMRAVGGDTQHAYVHTSTLLNRFSDFTPLTHTAWQCHDSVTSPWKQRYPGWLAVRGYKKMRWEHKPHKWLSEVAWAPSLTPPHIGGWISFASDINTPQMYSLCTCGSCGWSFMNRLWITSGHRPQIFDTVEALRWRWLKGVTG